MLFWCVWRFRYCLSRACLGNMMEFLLMKKRGRKTETTFFLPFPRTAKVCYDKLPHHVAINMLLSLL